MISILYITINENLSSLQDGVSKKLLTKVAAIRSQVPQCILLNASINHSHSEIKILNKNDEFIDIEIGVEQANVGYFNKIKSDIFFYRQLIGYITRTGLNYDRFIFRYPFASYGLKVFANTFFKKIVFEHNTKELEELKISIASKSYASFSLRPSKLFFWFQEKVYPLYCENVISKKIFANAYAGSCVTSEIAHYESRRSKNYRTFVSSNFYNVSQVTLSKSHYQKEAGTLHIGMIVTTTASWYGLDRLLNSFSLFQDKYILTIAGIESDNSYIQNLILKNGIKKNINLLGKINDNALVLFYNTVHVCMGSLGLYKINLQYASTLKVKECISFGIPVVTAYNEEDFVKNEEFEPYYLQLKNDDSLIDFNLIEKFTAEFYNSPGNKQSLRNLALKYIDVKVKISQLLQNIKA